MAAVEREEFNDTMNRVFTKLDTNHESTNAALLGLSLEVMEVKTKVNTMPDQKTRPCSDFKEHIVQHKAAADSWKKPIIVGIIAIFLMLIQAPIKAFLSHIFN